MFYDEEKKKDKVSIVEQKLLECDINAINYLLKEHQGRYFIAWLFNYCKINATTYNIFKPKILQNEGKRQIALATYNSIYELAKKNKQVAKNFELMETENQRPKNIIKYLRNKLGEKRRLKEAMDYILNDKNGRWFLARLYNYCHITALPYADITKTDYLYKWEGERQVAFCLNKLITKFNQLQKKQLAINEYEQYKTYLSSLIDVENKEW